MANETQKIRKLLVIEDKEKHISDARALFEDRKKRGLVEEVLYATNYEQAINYLESENPDCILSDVFFPRQIGGLEEQLGTSIAEKAIEKGLPLIFVTDSYHHGQKLQPVCEWVRERSLPELVDLSRSEEENPRKKWTVGYLMLAHLRDSFIRGKARYESGELVDRDLSLNHVRNFFLGDAPFSLNDEIANLAYALDYASLDIEKLPDSIDEIKQYVKNLLPNPSFKELYSSHFQGLYENLKGIMEEEKGC